MAAAGTDRKAKLKKAMLITATVCFGGLILFLGTIFVSNWVNSPSAPVQTASSGRVAPQAPDPCDNVYRKYPLTQEPIRIVAAEGCKMGWDILKGEVVLVGPGGVESRPITSGNPLPGFHGVKWRSHGATALVEARFYR